MAGWLEHNPLRSELGFSVSACPTTVYLNRCTTHVNGSQFMSAQIRESAGHNYDLASPSDHSRMILHNGQYVYV